MPRRLLLAWFAVALAVSPARAQMPFPRDLVPTRTALGRLGLERHWMAVVPLTGDERLLGISIAAGPDDAGPGTKVFVFAQTNKGYFHTFDGETGQLLWTARLGDSTARVRPASVNKQEVFVSNLNRLIALDRRTGVKIWTQPLDALPSSPTACDDDRVMVGLASGKLYGYGLKVKEGVETRLSDHAIDVWNWQAAGPIETRPLPAGKFVVFGSDDGKVYVALADERTMVYRIPTGGPIGAGFGTHGTRTLLVPSGDKNLYAIDLFTAQVKWTHPSGAPLLQEPLVSGDDVYVVNQAGALSAVDVNTGSPRWTISTQGGPLLTVGEKRVYLESHDGDMFIVERSTGKILFDPQETRQRVGLNIREFEFGPTNRLDDRIYMATRSGMIVSLRETGKVRPTLGHDPKSKPFGYIPDEGVSLELKPAGAPPAEAAPPAADKPAEDMPAPADKPADAPADAPK